MNYEEKVQQIIDNITQVDDHPIWLGVELWQPNPIPIYEKLPKHFNGINGFAYQPYNTKIDDIERWRIEEIRDFWLSYADKVSIAEFGYCINGTIQHGKTSSEQNKSRMITEFLDCIYTWDVFACYFGLTYFPPEKADFGLIYENNTLKQSGIQLKNILRR